MKEFNFSHHSVKSSEQIPEEYDFFDSLVGEWEIERTDRLLDAVPRRVKGEWIFSWVLDSMAIQDLLIIPPRANRLIDKSPDAEYDIMFRIFTPETSTWNIFTVW